MSTLSGFSEGFVSGKKFKYAPLKRAQGKPDSVRVNIGSEVTGTEPNSGDLLLVCSCNSDGLETSFTLVRVLGQSDTANAFVGVNKFTDKASRYPNSGVISKSATRFAYYAASFIHEDPFGDQV